MLTIARPACLTLTVLISGQCMAAEFSRFLNCAGQLSANGKGKAATLDLAMRDNSAIALIQRSNVLPVGERLKYVATPMSYTMLYKLPLPGTRYYNDWVHGQWLVWQPNLKRLATIRIAIDRQTAELEGELLDFNDESLGTLAMDCKPMTLEDMPEPKL